MSIKIIVLTVQYTLGFGLMAAAMCYSSKAFTAGSIDGIADLLTSITLGIFGFVFLKDLILSPVERLVGGLFYSNKGEVKHDFSQIDGHIVRHEYGKAQELLSKLIEEHPEESQAYFKSCELYYDKMKNAACALEIAYHRLNSDSVSLADEKLLFLTVDILEEGGNVAHAVELLNSMTQKTPHVKLQAAIHRRLASLNSSQSISQA